MFDRQVIDRQVLCLLLRGTEGIGHVKKENTFLQFLAEVKFLFLNMKVNSHLSFTQYFVEAPFAAITASGLIGYELQAWHTCIWEFLPFFSADPFKLCQVGWGALLHSYFQVSPEMFDRVQVRALAGPPKDIPRLVPKPLLRCLDWVLRVIVLLDGEPSPQSEVLSTLERGALLHQGSL
uniref:Uncharacterized protein n=1 Tax=Salmo trutta TaxID=8032 RepID=A0A673ZKN5_SALTR